MELINMFSFDLSEKDLKEIKGILADYFAKKVTSQMDDYFEKHDLGDETIEKWSHEHLRFSKQK